MPAGGIHLCLAESVARKLKKEITLDFLIGNVAPDSWRNSSSTKEGTHFINLPDSFDYNYEYFYEKYQEYLSNDFVLGYLVHLITDKYWHNNNFITTIVEKDEYDDLNKACSMLVGMYNIPKLTISSALVNPVEELDTLGISKTIDYLNSVNYLSDTNNKYNIDELVARINDTCLFVVSELSRLQEKEHKMTIKH